MTSNVLLEQQKIIHDYAVEKELREKYPEVQRAWERYQILVELYKTQRPEEDIDWLQFG